MEEDIIEEKDITSLDAVKVKKNVQEMIGIHHLPVPVYSAIKVKGEPLYKKARRGEKVILPIKKMVVYSAELLKIKPACRQDGKEKKRYVITLKLHVSSGTYIRSIVEELGRRLGYPATTRELRRIRIGAYDIADANKPTTV